MSILLFVIGAITLVLGALAIGFGIPINEFSFGNTLIMAGTTAAVGGLIVIGLGAVVSYLQRLADTIAVRAPLRPNRPPEVAEAARSPVASRIPFPPTPEPVASEPAVGEAPPVEPPPMAPAVAAMPADEAFAQGEAPTLPNPDVPPSEEEPPSFAAPPPAAEAVEPAVPASPPPRFSGLSADEHEPEPEPEPLPAWLSAPRKPEPPPSEPHPFPDLRPQAEANFESVWPAAADRSAGQPAADENEPAVAVPAAPEPPPEAPAPSGERRGVAILKSGVVDGMAYTLYVDGSIEAELPQGTLHFASINDLREHLEKTS